jgi:hypothetical protein
LSHSVIPRAIRDIVDPRFPRSIHQPEKVPDLPLGQNWRMEKAFHKKIFKDLAGDLLIKLEYENDNDW